MLFFLGMRSALLLLRSMFLSFMLRAPENLGLSFLLQDNVIHASLNLQHFSHARIFYCSSFSSCALPVHLLRQVFNAILGTTLGVPGHPPTLKNCIFIGVLFKIEGLPFCHQARPRSIFGTILAPKRRPKIIKNGIEFLRKIGSEKSC